MTEPNHHFGFAHPDAAAAATGPGRAVVPGHEVQFYDRDESLTDRVGEYLADGVKLGQPIVVIATGAHRRALAERMRFLGTDPDELVEGRDAIWLDAAEVLAAFMEGGDPSAELFDATVGSVFERLTAHRPYVVVRAFGEMVELLWRGGRAESALALEALWNELLERYRFALLCAYSQDAFQVDGDPDRVRRLHAAHGHVLPGTDAPRVS